MPIKLLGLKGQRSQDRAARGILTSGLAFLLWVAGARSHADISLRGWASPPGLFVVHHQQLGDTELASNVGKFVLKT